MKVLSIWLFMVIGTVLFVGARPALALDPKVDDQTQLFSADAITRANTVIAQIEHKFGKDVIVEVYPKIPDDMKEKYGERGFGGWQAERAKQLGVNGVYILIVREPFHVEVGVDGLTRKAAFTADDRDHVRDILIGKFRARDYDGGLTDAVSSIQSTMTEHWNATHGNNNYTNNQSYQPRSNYQPPYTGSYGSGNGGGGMGSGISGMACFVIGIVAISIIFSAVRRLFGGGYGGYGMGGGYGGGYGGYGMGGGYGGGGGGFLSGLLGGAVGGAAGSYLENKFDRPSGGGGFFGGGGGGGSAPDNSSWGNGAGQDFSSSGGDVGGGGGGGDFSGGGGGSSGGDV